MGASVHELRLLGGITAAGKTDWAIAWAKAKDANILSCDSVACYRGLDIGSAKPGKKERSEVTHHGLDLAEVHEVFGVGDYHDYAGRVLLQASQEKKSYLVVGGSGFFMEGFLRPVVDGMEIPQSVRAQVDDWYEKEGLEGCLVRLENMNPSGLASLDKKNQARVRRALERCIHSGKELIEIKREFEALPSPYGAFSKSMIWLDRENDDLEARIEKRTETMLGSGMIEETQKALSIGMDKHPSLSNAVGYREVRLFLEGHLSRTELSSAISGATRKLVSKQRKWFRNRFPAQSRYILKAGQIPSLEELEWIAST